MSKKIIIICADPHSINSEIIFKTWNKISLKIKKSLYLIGSIDLLQKQFKKLNYNIALTKVHDINSINNTNKLKVINIDLFFYNSFKIEKKKLKKYIYKSLNLAHKLALNNKNISGVINCPIDKKLLGTKGFGVTEYFASKCLVKNNSEVMLIRNNKLAVSPITTHSDLKDISKKIKKKLIITKVKSINFNFKKIFARKPKIAILGLNPHNAEFRKNSEEIKIIMPAIKSLKKLKLRVYGPYISDTIFISDYKKFDVIVGMYHDQVLAPFKALFKFNAINLTLGLKYLRVSPDHGVALNLIGKNKANPNSLLECIKFINKFS